MWKGEMVIAYKMQYGCIMQGRKDQLQFKYYADIIIFCPCKIIVIDVLGSSGLMLSFCINKMQF